MDNIVIGLFYLLTGYAFSKMVFPPKESKKGVEVIDDKNFIIDGEFVSFEENTPLLQWQQECEDQKHYNNFESQRLENDRNHIFEGFMHTKEFIIGRYKSESTLIKKPTKEDFESKENIERYNVYVNMVEKLSYQKFMLTFEEYLIERLNPIFCGSIYMFFLKPIGFYTIYNEKTAKYAKGNMNELMRAEFKSKWY